ncbi:MAG: DUF4230 domain-containing protein [Phormidesmis priestleyi]|uniref:DUF4230 domain-containing protein n=1 Tax=Phormidesmis priestleyi TaxID=268141 RepID=A0A2W4Y014_9CYAN|nr:MAG: DUF4230 domain-containing protein [Phormidesmis priestleyi]
MKSRMPDPYRHKPAPLKRDRASKRSPIFRSLQLIAISITGGAVIVASLAGLAFLRSGSRFIDGVKLALTPQPPVEKVDVRTVVVKQIRSASELTTAVFTMEAVVPAQSDRKIGDYTIGKTNLLYIAYGEVRAGVNLEDISADDVIPSEDGMSVELTLPAAKLLDTKIDVTRSSVYDYSRGFLNLGPDRAPELQSAAQQEALIEIEKAACDQNILKQANDRAELVVTQLLQSTGFETVTVKNAADPTAECKTSNSPANSPDDSPEPLNPKPELTPKPEPTPKPGS